MLSTDADDHRLSSGEALLSAMSEGDPLALAEAYHRTSAAAYSCAMRLVGSRAEAEQLLRAAYQALWEETPEDVPLEAWIRYRVFVEGRARLRDTMRSAASPSTTLLLRDAPVTDAPLDHTERLIAGLDDDALRALLLAHDRGIPTPDQRSDAAEAGLRRALFALAEADDPGDCDTPGLADFVLGLLGGDEADRVEAALARDAECAAVLRTMRRGRRRIEGVPPPPDAGNRIIAYVLASSIAQAGLRAAGTSPADSPAAADAAAEPTTGPHAGPEGGDAPGLGAEPVADTEPTAEWGEPMAGPSPDAEIPDAGPAPASVLEGAETEDLDAAGADVEGLRPIGPEGTEEAAEPPSALDEMLTDLPSAPPDAPYPAEGPQPPPAADRTDAAAMDEAGAAEASQAEELGPETDEQLTVSIDSREGGGAPWGSGRADEADEDRLRFEEADFDEAEGGRRALTIALTIVGGLLLLAAGAVAGLLAIRIFVG